jgi:hypothetical protein
MRRFADGAEIADIPIAIGNSFPQILADLNATRISQINKKYEAIDVRGLNHRALRKTALKENAPFSV